MAKKKMTFEEKLDEAIVKDATYEVPENWTWTYMNNIGEYINGKAFKPIDWDTKGLPIIRIQNLTGTNNEFNYFSGEIEEKYKIVNNDLLMAWSATLDAFLWNGNDAVLNQHIFKVRSLINKKYHYYLLKNTIQEMYSKTHGTGMVHITKGKFEKLEVPLPPLKEQQRIVDKIESLFEKLDKTKELIEEVRDDFEKRKSAILEKAFRGELTKKWRAKNKGKILNEIELFNQIKESRFSLITSNKEKREIESIFNDYKFIDQTLPDGWIKLKSSMVCALISCGKTPTGKISDKGEVAYLKVYNIVNNKIDFEYKPQFIDYETHSTKLKNSMLRPNDVIMNIVGPPLKKIAIIPETYEHWNINQALVRFRTIDCINYKYYYYCLLYDDTLKEVINSTRGVVGQANISVSQARDLDIIIPSLEEQKEIVRILDKLLEEEAKIEELTKLEEQIELIKKSILAKAFRGQLGTNSEDDESAIELLKEILNK